MVARRQSVLILAAALAAWILLGAGAVWASPPKTLALVTLQPLASNAAGERLIASIGGDVVETIKPLSMYRVALPEDQADASLNALRARGDLVRSAEVEGEQVAQVVPNDPLYRTFQWNLRRIGMEQAWDLRPSASDVVVAVLDTGVDLNHPDLKPNLLLDQGYDFLNDLPAPQDDESHGTAVAGIIGAIGNNHDGVTGIAWHVKLLPIKALNSQGRGPDSVMVKAILYAADSGARIINISSTGTRYSAALETAVEYAEEKGALVVAAAGNTGNGDNAVNYPAAFDGVLAVAAIDANDQLASFSQRQPYVALAAPGVDVPSTAWAGAGRGLYASQSGTSIAAPHVSGAAALLWALRPDLVAADIAAALRSSADKVASPDPGYGSGILDVARAIERIRRDDPDAEPWARRVAAYQQRLCQGVAHKLADEHRLASGWTAGTAADMLWALMSTEPLERLLRDRGWSRADYAERLALLLRSTFVKPEVRDTTCCPNPQVAS